jgi:hypothetical protein
MKVMIRLLMLVSGAIALSIPSAISHASQSPAGQKNSPQASRRILVARLYSPPRPPRRGAPGTNRGAASRGCLVLAKPTQNAVLDNLGALVPAYQENASTHVWARTASDRPTLWFYNPYKPDSIDSIEFALQDEQDADIYRGTISLPETVGVIGVQVPKTVSLQSGKLYHWYLTVRGKDSACNSRATSSAGASTLQPANSMTAMVYVDGWIERTPLLPTLSDRLKQATPQQQASLYGENGFWHDAVTALATMKLTKPGDATIKTDWQTLLQEGGLEQLSGQPLVNCCLLRSEKPPLVTGQWSL